MTSPYLTPNPTARSTEFGPLIGEYRSSPRRYGYALFGIVSLYLALSGTIGVIEFDTGYRIFWAVAAVVCIGQVLLGLGTHAELYERGFVISLSGKTITAHWESIAKVSHTMTRSYILGVIPQPWRSHEVTITLTNRQQMSIDSDDFQRVEQMGNTIQRKWTEARRNMQGTEQ